MKITIFTPTYNRAYIIDNLYKSLQRQTYIDFEWIVANDGSTDDTDEYFKEIKKEKNLFTITYIAFENGGKHRAINKGLEIASGELFFIVDSDDYLTDDALERLVFWENTILHKKNFCGISGLKGTSVAQCIGSTFTGDSCDAHYHEREIFNIFGDKAEAYYTHVLKQYLFKEFQNENFITEATVWLPMGASYKIRYFNEVIYLCDYLDDGLSKNMSQIILNNPRGEAYYIRLKIKFYKLNLKNRLAAYYYYGELYKNLISRREVISYLQIKWIVFVISKMIFKTVNFAKQILK